MLTTYILAYKTPSTNERTKTITIILTITILHTITNPQPPHHTSQPMTHIHNIEHLIQKSPTIPLSHTHTYPALTTTHHITIDNPPPINIIIINITNIGTICHITHIHQKTPKTKLAHYYTWNNTKNLLLSGDIQPNPGPLSYITRNLPHEFIQRQKQYFIHNTTSLQPRYAHLENIFAPHLIYDTQSTPHQELTAIQRHKLTLSKHPLHLQIYALIITYSPIPQECNQHMTNGIDPRCLNILRKIQNLPNNTLSNTIHINHHTPNTTPHTIAQAYTHINTKIAQGETINMSTLKNEIPHLPYQILQETIKCTIPVTGYHHNTNITRAIHPIRTNTNIEDQHTSQLKIITWNAGCINSSLSGILELTQKLHKDPHIVFIQETKLHKLKSTSYIDRKFQNYKIIYNNSNNITQKQNRYSNPNKVKGGVLTMIPKNIHSNENITKIPTPSSISPYLQAIMIKNKPITPILLINMYMPTHPQDLHLIQEIQDQIQTLTQSQPTAHIILGGDFNRDILLIGRSHNGTTSPPNPNDYEWARFTQSIGLNIIKNQATHTRQGGHNYTLTSLIDGFYSNHPHHNNLQSHTITNLNQNSDHYPVQLQLTPNSVIIKTKPTPNPLPRITYPIPKANLQNLHTTFLDKQNLAIDTLTNILKQEKLTIPQWEEAQTQFNNIINSLSNYIEHTCMTLPTPPLPHRAKLQGGFLPRQQQKIWKSHLKIHHNIRKVIHIACHHPHTQLHNHPDIQALLTPLKINIPPLPTNHIEHMQWIEALATIGKTAKIEAYKITAKQTTINCKIAIKKYRTLLNTKPKTIHKKIFQPTTESCLDCIQNPQGIIITNPTDIANEIYQSQQTSFQKQAPTCDDTIDHPSSCMCAIRKYPWHTQDGLILDKRGPQGAQISTQFTRAIYDKCVKRLTKGKAPGPDNIPNDIIKTLPSQCHDLIYLFFHQCYQHKEIPTQWKHSKTILLHKKEDPTQLANYRPIALANTIYKLYTSTITTLLTSYGEQHRLLHFSQEGFRPQRNTSRQIQMIIASLKDARLTNQDIYITYIDFKNAFGSIDHARLLALMEDLGYPKDAVEIVGNIYTNSTTSFTGTHFGTTPPINVSRGTIQGDTLSPYLFIIFLEPLLRWLEKDNIG